MMKDSGSSIKLVISNDDLDDINEYEGKMIKQSVSNRPRHSFMEDIELASRFNDNPIPIQLKLMSFQQAAREGSLDILESILKLIHKSILEFSNKRIDNSQERLEELLNWKINAKDSKGMTALHYAAQNCNTKVCEMLYKYSFIPPFEDLSSASSSMNTTVVDTTYWGNKTTKSQLNIYSTNNKLATPLHFVAQGKKSPEDKIVKQLSKKHSLIKKERSRIEIVQEIVSTMNNSDNCLTRLLQWGNKKELKDVRDYSGMTPLHWAAQKNNVNAVTKLIRFQPQVNNTPARWKERRKTVKSVTFFTMENSTLLDAQDHNKMTALSVAAAHSAEDVAELLIELKADLTIVDKTGKSALHHAAAEGNFNICQLIIDKIRSQFGESNVKIICGIKDKHSQTPLHFACQKTSVKTVKLLLDNGDKALAHMKNDLGNTPFHSAAMVGCCIEVLQLFVEKKVDISVTNNIGRTALHIAAQYNHNVAVEFLIEQGANLEAKDHLEKTPLLLAVQFGHANLVSCMLENQCNILTEDRDDKNCLHIAALFNQVSVLRVLLQHEQSTSLINQKDQEGNTPLHFAAAFGHHQVVERLLECEFCDLSSKDGNERTPIHLAAYYGHTRILKMLWRKDHTQLYHKDENGNTPLISAAMAGKENSTKTLVNMRANLEEGNNNSYTALTCCALNDFTSTARILLKAGANVDPTGECLVSPLHVACIYGSLNMVDLLLEYDASVTLYSSGGLNPLELAIKHGHVGCVKGIINSSKWKAALRSTQVNKRNKYLTTPLREMIRTMPEMAQLVFSKCTSVSPNKSWDDPKYSICYDFEFVDDIYSATTWQSTNSGIAFQDDTSINSNCFREDGSISALAIPYTEDRNMLRKNHPLYIMTQYKNKKLLSHPLIKTLLDYKWRKYGRTMYYFLLLMYSLFLFAITFYIIPLPPPYLVEFQGNGSSLCYILKTNHSFWKQENCPNSCCQHQWTAHEVILSIIIIILSLIGLIKEGFQMFQMKFSYLKELDNYTDLLTYILALLSITKLTEKTRITGIKEDWQWQLAALCVLISWINFALFVRKLPALGIYVIMVLDIFKTFGKFFFTYAIFVCGFGLFYYMMLQNQSVYNTWYDSLIKTTVMMIGELDYESIFYSDEITCDDSMGPNCMNGYNGYVQYPTTTKVVFVFFLFIMPIIIMNLLVGLAVDDIQSVQEQATRQKMAMKIKLALDVEFLMPETLRKKFSIGHYQVYPNLRRPKKRFLRFFYQDEIETIKQSGIKYMDTKDMLDEQKEHAHKHFRDLKHDMELLIINTKKLHESVKNVEKLYKGGTQL